MVLIQLLLPTPGAAGGDAMTPLGDARHELADRYAEDVARVGFHAMMRGDGDVVSGWKNKFQSAIANVTPAGMLARNAAETTMSALHGTSPSANATCGVLRVWRQSWLAAL
jgi:hypothetical protein